MQNINFGESSVYINTTSCTESIVANHVTGKHIGLAAQNIFVTDCENVNVLEATDSVFANRCTSLCSAVPINWKAKNLNLSFVNMASYSSIRFSCDKFLYSHISFMAESIQMDHLFHYKKKDGVLYKIMDEDIQRIGMLNRLCSSFKALKDNIDDEIYKRIDVAKQENDEKITEFLLAIGSLMKDSVLVSDSVKANSEKEMVSVFLKRKL